MVKVKSSQKIFTDSEVASLTGICVDHLHNFARSRHLGFIARAAEAAGAQADQWLFTLSDLMVSDDVVSPLHALGSAIVAEESLHLYFYPAR